MKCKRILKNLSAYADGELKPKLRDRLTTHLASCEGCAAELSRVQKVAHAARASLRTIVSTKEPPSDLRRKLIQSLPPRPAPRRVFIPVRRLAAAIILAFVAGSISTALLRLRSGLGPDALRRTIAVQRRAIADTQRVLRTAQEQLLAVKAKLTRTEQELRIASARIAESGPLVAQSIGEERRALRPFLSSVQMPGAQNLMENGLF